MAKVSVVVRLKSGVLDPQGKTVAHSLHTLGFEEVDDVRIGKLIEIEVADGLEGETRRARVRTMCEKLLANPVIEDFEILGG